MTIEFRHPRPGEEAALRELFTEAFEDAAFTDLFFSRGFSAERCFAAFDGRLLAALHWFDCTLMGEKAAYVYGIAAFKSQRGRGIGSALIRAALERLKVIAPPRLALFSSKVQPVISASLTSQVESLVLWKKIAPPLYTQVLPRKVVLRTVKVPPV